MNVMANIREFHDFKGHDVVLLWLSRDELPALSQALGPLHANGSVAVTLGDCRLLLKKQRSTGVNLTTSAAEICLADADVEQLEGLIEGLIRTSGPGHQYMDIGWPGPTLVISVDEYPADFA
jgi:hypothetical protein